MRTVITSKRSGLRIDWRELWEYRDLLGLLVRRDLTAIYKQTVLGPAWFILQPLATTLVFTVIFGQVANISTDGIPHIIFYMSGTVLWNYFQGCMNYGASSLVANAQVLSKVYFPRLIIPLAGVIVHLAHFTLNLAMFLGFYIYFVFFTSSIIQPSLMILWLPVIVLQCALIGLGVGLWVAGLTTKFRDLTFAIPFLTQMWMYATPIVYPASLVKSPVSRAVLWLNPMSAPVELCRFAFTGISTVTPQAVAVSWAVTIFILVTGLLMFNRVQRSFVDTI